MSIVETTHQLDHDELEKLRQPRTDLLHEVSDGPDAWRQEAGPFAHYRRTLTVSGEGSDSGITGSDGGRSSDRRLEVTERTEFRLAMPVWSPLFRWPIKRVLASTDRQPRQRWWWPEQVLSARASTLISVVAVVGIVSGYLGVIIGQTIAFAAEEFGADESDQGRTLAAVRIGILISVIFIRRADRIGRRPLLIGFATASILVTALGALAPNMVTLGVTQAIARGLATGLATLIILAVTEEIPAEVRSIGVGMITLASGLGAGMVVWVLPVADLGVSTWRIVYLVPLLFLPVMVWAWKVLPETRRFDAAIDATTSADVVNRGRFWLLAMTAFASAIFLSPASQLMNQYLKDEIGFSATRISFFRLLVFAPIALFVLGAGFLADRIGRRPVGAVGIAFGTSASAAVYFVDGAWLWIMAMAGGWLTAAAYTALRGYQTELFPTRARARVGGWLDMISVAGSAVGLVIAGELAVHWGRLGPGMAVLLVGPMLVLVALILFYPETARVELEEFNPGDPRVE